MCTLLFRQFSFKPICTTCLCSQQSLQNCCRTQPMEAQHTHFNASSKWKIRLNRIRVFLPGRVRVMYCLTTTTRTFVNLQLNKSKLLFSKSESCTNVNSAFMSTRHGEFTNVSTKASFAFVNVMTRDSLTYFCLLLFWRMHNFNKKSVFFKCNKVKFWKYNACKNWWPHSFCRVNTFSKSADSIWMIENYFNPKKWNSVYSVITSTIWEQ